MAGGSSPPPPSSSPSTSSGPPPSTPATESTTPIISSSSSGCAARRARTHARAQAGRQEAGRAPLGRRANECETDGQASLASARLCVDVRMCVSARRLCLIAGTRPSARALRSLAHGRARVGFCARPFPACAAVPEPLPRSPPRVPLPSLRSPAQVWPAGISNTHARTHTHARTRAHARTHTRARTHARARARTRTARRR